MVPIAIEPGESARDTRPRPRQPASIARASRGRLTRRARGVSRRSRSGRRLPRSCPGSHRPRRTGTGRSGGRAPRPGRRRRRPGRGRRRRIRRQQLRVQPLQLAPGLHAELLGDRPARQGVRLERLGPASRLVEGPHQQRPEPLPHGMVPHQAAQLRHHLGRPAAGEVRLDAQLGRVEPELGRPLGGGDERRGPRDIGQQRPAPQPERLAEQLGGAVRSAGRQLGPALGRRAPRTPGCQRRPVPPAAGSRAPGGRGSVPPRRR